jgi:hypothetical protein
MSKRLYSADVNIQADTLIYTYECGREGEHAPTRATAEQKINIKEISSLADKVSKALSGCDVSNLKTLGGTLYDLLIPKKFAAVITPSQDALELPQQTSRDSFVFYLLNPKIAWIPWELLYDGDAFLCRRFCVSRSLVKTGDEYELAQKRLDALRQPGVMVLLGETSGLKKEEEIEEILRILRPVVGNDRIVVRDAANRRVTVDHLKENYDICHFIGHGVFSAKNRKESGWRLQDGTVLTCSDIERVKSPKTVFPRLIIANSCYSARSAPSPSNAQKYVTSLYRSFLSMGVPQYIGTIASVPDDVSQVFTSAFYTALASGKPVGEAVFQAREAASAGPGWGYYVHYGDPGFPLLASTGSQSHPLAVGIPTSGPPALEVIIAQRRQPDTVHVRRYDKLRLVRNRIQRFTQGYSDAVLLRGEAGVGKSVFLTDILDEVKSTVPNALCGIASCKRSNLKREYVPFKELLQSLVAPTYGSRFSHTQTTINEYALRAIMNSPQLFYLSRPDLLFAADWPQVRRRVSIHTDVPAIGAVDHEHLVRELKAFMAELCQKQHVVIVLEDLHWADAASLDIFFDVVGIIGERFPVLTLGTFRSHGSPTSLHSHLSEARQRGMADISLDFDVTNRIFRRFTGRRDAEAFVIRYLKKVLPISSSSERPSYEFVRALVKYTAANGLLLPELVHLLRTRNRIFRRSGKHYNIWEYNEVQESLITEKIQGWIEERINGLDNDCRTTLMHASVEGEVFSLDLLSKLLSRNPGDTLKLLEKLRTNFKLIEANESWADKKELLDRAFKSPYEMMQKESPTFHFRHSVVAQYFHGLLESGERKRLHSIAGEYRDEFSKRGSREIQTPHFLAKQSQHFIEAGDYKKALTYRLLAAKGSRKLGLYTDAIGHYREARQLWERIDPGACGHAEIDDALRELTPFEWRELTIAHYGLLSSKLPTCSPAAVFRNEYKALAREGKLKSPRTSS